MRRSARTALLAGAPCVLGACRPAAPRLPPEGAPVCPAPDPMALTTTVWEDERGIVAAPPPPESAAARLAGEYRVLEFTTEGAPGAPATRWTMRLVAADDSLWRSGARWGGPTLLAGARLRRGAPFDSARAAAGRLSGLDAVAVRYTRDARGTSSLGFQTEPGVLDGGGSLYWVSTASDSVLVGRWTYGGIGASIMRRGGAWTFERPSGFFCARRVRPAASP